MRHRFDGEICGFGTASGHRVVVGRWPTSPFGSVADVMLEDSAGWRRLLAPTTELADFIAATYTFDEVEIVDVEASRSAGRLAVKAGRLEAEVTIGARAALGWVLRAVPGPLAGAPGWASFIDPIARRVLDGVRTRGSAGSDRREWYGARDLRLLEAVSASWDGNDLGVLAPVDPPVRFGFGSTPRRPSIVRVTTTVETADGPA